MAPIYDEEWTTYPHSPWVREHVDEAGLAHLLGELGQHASQLVACRRVLAGGATTPDRVRREECLHGLGVGGHGLEELSHVRRLEGRGHGLGGEGQAPHHRGGVGGG